MVVTNPYIIARGAPGIHAGLYYLFDTETGMADPGAGTIRLNHATAGSVTAAAISVFTADANNPDVSGWLAALLDATGAKGFLSIIDGDNPVNWFRGRIASVSAESGWFEMGIDTAVGSGTLSSGAALRVTINPSGDDGAAWDQWRGAWETATGYERHDLAENNGSTYTCTVAHTSGSTTEPGAGVDWETVWALGAARGSDGTDPGVLLTWDDGTSDADPGSGEIRANNADLSSATFIYVSKTNRAASDIEALLLSFGTANAVRKGTLILTRPADEAQVSFDVSAVTDATGYVKFAVANHSGVTAFAASDPISLQFSPMGNTGLTGASLLWDDSTSDADPGSGKIRANNASLASATELYISKTTRTGSDIEALLLSFAGSTSSVKGTAILQRGADLKQAAFVVTGVTDASGYVNVSVTDHSGETDFSAGDSIGLVFSATGDKGDKGDRGIGLAWDDANDDSDPGSGKIKADNDDLSSATELYVSKTSAGGSDLGAFLLSLDDSTSLMKGTLTLTRTADQVLAIFSVTGATDAIGYVKVAVSHIGGATGFSAADVLGLEYTRTGDMGDTGTDPGVVYTFNDSTAGGDPGTGKLAANNADLSAAFELYLSETNDAGDDVSAWLAALDDANATVKGLITMTRVSDGSQALWRLTALSVESDHVVLAVEGHSGRTSFTDGDRLSFQFARAGNDGEVAGPESSETGNLAGWGDSGGSTLTDLGVAPLHLVSILGLVPSNASDTDHDITFTAGVAVDDTLSVLMRLDGSITKRADAEFAEGNNAGGMVTGESLPTSGTIHWWLIGKADGTIDICCNNHASSGLSPTLPSGFIYKRILFSITTDASANITGFFAWPEPGGALRVMLKTTTQAFNLSGTLGTTPAAATILPLPVGRKFWVEIAGRAINTSSSIFVLIQSVDETSATASNTIYDTHASTSQTSATFCVQRLTNTSRQLRASASAESTFLIATLRWWRDDRII